LIDPAARLLLDSGAYVDRLNKEGKTAADVRNETIEKYEHLPVVPTHTSNFSQQAAAIGENCVGDSWFRDYDSNPNLKFQSGRVVRMQRVPYSHLPPTLRSVVISCSINDLLLNYLCTDFHDCCSLPFSVLEFLI